MLDPRRDQARSVFQYSLVVLIAIRFTVPIAHGQETTSAERPL